MKWSRIFGAILAILGAVGAVLRLTFETAIIISLGIHAVSFLTTAAGFAIGIGGTSFVLSFVPQIKQRLEQGRENRLLRAKIASDNEDTADYEADSLNPEKVRVRLLQLKSKNPNLTEIMEVCLVQKDEIDKYQGQLDKLIQANEALYLNDIPAVLDSAEERMCANFRDIINCCLLVEDNNKSISERNQRIVDEAVQANSEELNAVAVLLDRSVEYINNYNRKGISDRSELDAWIKTMEDEIHKKGEITLG